MIQMSNSRLGEINYNNFGSKIKIIAYRKFNDIDIYFEEYDWIAYNREYGDFKKGGVECPYEPRVYNIGYVGDGKYKTKINGKSTMAYEIWKGMLRRCYDKKYHEKYPTYKDCEVCEEWLNFQNFAEWYRLNYYEVGNEKMHLDKDILYKGNKIYSPETCVFVPQRINSLFNKSKTYKNKTNKELPIGVFEHGDKYIARCRVYKDGKSESIYLGTYNTEYEAFKSYKAYKENLIKQVADYYEHIIDRELYKAMYEYEIEIDD